MSKGDAQGSDSTWNLPTARSLDTERTRTGPWSSVTRLERRRSQIAGYRIGFSAVLASIRA